MECPASIVVLIIPYHSNKDTSWAAMLAMEAELCHNFKLLPNCANHNVIGATCLPL